MNINEEYELSCYKVLARLHDKKEIYLVKHIETGKLGVKKLISHYNKAIYTRLCELNIANIPQILFCAEKADELIVIEEFINGRTLKDEVIENGILTEKQVMEIMLSLCDILSKLHECVPPIIHRDIKPSNIMLSNDGVVKLIDFNAAREYREGETEDTVLMGTRSYAAPEQYGFAQSDARTDIYALGVTMNYLLTGEVLNKATHQGRLLEIINKCTQVNMNDRYNDIGMLRSDLTRLYDNGFKGKNDYAQTGFFTRKRYDNDRLPVGFRTGIIWKMLLALFGYAMIIWVSLTTRFKDTGGVYLGGYRLYAYRAATLIIFMGYVFFIGNYRNVRYRLPCMNKNKILHAIMCCVYLFVWTFSVLIALAFVTYG